MKSILNINMCDPCQPNTVIKGLQNTYLPVDTLLEFWPKEDLYFLCKLNNYTLCVMYKIPSLQGYELREEKSVRLMDRLPNVIIKYICSFMVESKVSTLICFKKQMKLYMNSEPIYRKLNIQARVHYSFCGYRFNSLF
jgi:hypothetical protein